jgi:hypothetical protein
VSAFGAVLLLAGILIALPLLAFWLGGRRFWSRLTPRAGRDPFREAMHRYHLTPQETAQVESAVSWGRALRDERLRRAAVTWAQELLDEQRARRRIRSLAARRGLGVAMILVLVAGAVLIGVHRDGVPWGPIAFWVALTPLNVWITRAPHRAIRLNSERTP